MPFTSSRTSAVFRAAITHWVRRTGHQVLVCPEMSYQVELGQEHLADRYPDDVAGSVDVLPAVLVVARSVRRLSIRTPPR